MTIFKFYSFENQPIENTAQLFEISDGAQPKPIDPVQRFGILFTTGRQIELTVPKDIHGKEWDIFRCQVLRHEDGVVLMALENNRSKHTTINLKDVEHEHHPFCLVIIDNRPDRQFVGIERNSAFGTNTDKVADILRMGLSYKMREYRRRIEIERLTKQTTDFWDVVDEIRSTFDDHVTRISIDYMDNGKSTKSRRANDLLAAICLLAQKSKSDALFELKAKTDEGVCLKEIRRDVQHIADICLTQPNYDLSVRFKNFGVYRYGADLVAQFSVDDNVAVDFAYGKPIIDFETGGRSYDLVYWLNRLSKLMNNNYKNEPIQPKRTRRSRR